MEDQEKKIREEIAGLPTGGITHKKIAGRLYTYYQWMENGRQRGRVVHAEEEKALEEGIARRKALQGELRRFAAAEKPAEDHVASRSSSNRNNLHEASLHTEIRAGEALQRFAEPVRGWKKRALFHELEQYIYGSVTDRVLILYGLRRTGKTTMIRQLVGEMEPELLGKTAFLQIHENNTMAELNQDIRYLEENGYRYLFLDEVTLMKDFIENAALLPDIFAASGIHIVMSGTDSLGFLFSEDEQLYDRCIMVHTTWIPYREFERVLGVHGIDEYIRYGGTMSLSGAHYQQGTFTDAESAGEYVDSAISHNIQHSLEHYQYGNHFRGLRNLYQRGELTSAINRVVEDMNHQFTLEVLTRRFESSDIGISAGNLRRDRNSPDDTLDRIDREMVTEELKKRLEILNEEEQRVKLTENHVEEIQEYLELLDLTRRIPVRYLLGQKAIRQDEEETVFTQPGLRYSQARSLIVSLMGDPVFRRLSFAKRRDLTERILSEIRGRMMEEMILLETQKAHPSMDIFKLLFRIGEFDMVEADPENGGCRIYEIKHSDKRAPEQYRHLIDAEKCREVEFQYGTIEGKYVIYRGPSGMEGEIQYQNAEEYLRSLT